MRGVDRGREEDRERYTVKKRREVVLEREEEKGKGRSLDRLLFSSRENEHRGDRGVPGVPQ